MRGDFRIAGELLGLDRGLIDQHDRDIIPDRIEAMTLQAAQAAAIGFEFQISPAGGTNEDLEQFRTDRHNVEFTSLPLSTHGSWGGTRQTSKSQNQNAG